MKSITLKLPGLALILVIILSIMGCSPKDKTQQQSPQTQCSSVIENFGLEDAVAKESGLLKSGLFKAQLNKDEPVNNYQVALRSKQSLYIEIKPFDNLDLQIIHDIPGDNQPLVEDLPNGIKTLNFTASEYVNGSISIKRVQGKGPYLMLVTVGST